MTVAVTGPTGAVGRSVIRSLEQDDRVGRILGMARRPFEPAFLGWRKTRYRRGNVLDRRMVDELVADADVVVHLAYAIVGSRGESARVNVAGSRNVFEATALAARPARLVFASSVAAYGYYAGNPVPLTEDVPARGSPEHYYSAHKAACEELLAEAAAGSGMQAYVLRPCIVAGPDAISLIRNLQLSAVTDRFPAPARRLLAQLPGLRPVVPDPGVPIQLVHHGDVGTAVCAAAMGAGPPGAYNLAAAGEVTMSDLARAVGAYAVPVPRALAVAASRLVTTLPWVPAEVEWVHAARCPMLMSTARARRDLAWKPRYTAREALTEMAGGGA
jgi:nucleoside-diphosphate-sugar epimerase